MSTKQLYIPIQICGIKVQVCLSMYDLLEDTRREMVGIFNVKIDWMDAPRWHATL